MPNPASPLAAPALARANRIRVRALSLAATLVSLRHDRAIPAGVLAAEQALARADPAGYLRANGVDPDAPEETPPPAAAGRRPRTLPQLEALATDRLAADGCVTESDLAARGVTARELAALRQHGSAAFRRLLREAA